MTTDAKILIVDDHAVVRAGLRMLLEAEEGIEVVGDVGTAEDAVRGLERLEPDLVLLDVEMPGIGGIEGSERVLKRRPEAKVVILSMLDDQQTVNDAFAAGASGYVLKRSADEELVRAVRAVLRGERYLDPALGATLAAPTAGPLSELSDRELEVLRLLALGYTNSEIASKLYVSTRTVESHRRNVSVKLRANSRSELVRLALGAGLITQRDAARPEAD
ncbi:MAG TPA: response regulator transcription factor [Miltoncostaeaceae bacterium]|nr:response regulator transcription factor [Miltoncostaeaceae bacterium]